MNTDDKVAQAAEAASDRMQEEAWGGDGPEDNPTWTSEQFARDAGDIILPEPGDKEAHKNLMIAIRDALFWHESLLDFHSKKSAYSMERAIIMTERLAQLGKLLINDIYGREYRSENFKDER